MIVVTGTKRSGTSMWMQVLIEGGFPHIGDAFPSNWGESIRESNPRGFYESRLRRGIYTRSVAELYAQEESHHAQHPPEGLTPDEALEKLRATRPRVEPPVEWFPRELRSPARLHRTGLPHPLHDLRPPRRSPGRDRREGVPLARGR